MGPLPVAGRRYVVRPTEGYDRTLLEVRALELGERSVKLRYPSGIEQWITLAKWWSYEVVEDLPAPAHVTPSSHKTTTHT